MHLPLACRTNFLHLTDLDFASPRWCSPLPNSYVHCTIAESVLQQIIFTLREFVAHNVYSSIAKQFSLAINLLKKNISICICICRVEKCHRKNFTPKKAHKLGKYKHRCICHVCYILQLCITICSSISICRQRVEIPQEKLPIKKWPIKKEKKKSEVPQEKWLIKKLPIKKEKKK